MADREAGDDLRDRTEGLAQQEERKQKREVVVTGQDVFDAEMQVPRQRGAGGGIVRRVR